MEDQNEINNATLEFDYQPTQENHSIIKVVGVGGGGSNAVQHMYEAGIQDVSFLIINTDKQALKGSSIPNKLLISEKGLGAGARPEVARECAVQYSDAIRQALSDGTEMVFITAGMGGGTGTGASPVVAQIAHEMGLLTVGIVTIPFQFEGRKKITAALEGVRAIERWCDALLVVNNNRLISIYPDLTFDNAFGKADDTLTVAAKSISDIINIQGYINLDFADVSTTLRNGGVALISTGQAEGEGRLTKAIQESITSPLLQDNKITDAKHLLFELCFSHDNPISMAEIGEMNKFVESLNPEIEVIWGAMYDDTLGDNVRIILLASGFAMDHTTGGVIVGGKETEMEKKLRAAICDTKDMLNEFADYPEASNIVMSAIRLAINKADNMTIDTDLDEELGKLTQAVENARTSVQAQKEAEEQEKKRIAEEEAKKEEKVTRDPNMIVPKEKTEKKEKKDLKKYKGLYTYDVEADHKFVIIVNKEGSDVNNLIATINKFNSEKQPLLNLKTHQTSGKGFNQIIEVGNLPDAKTAKSYLLQLTKDDSMRDALDKVPHRRIVISEENLETLKTSGNINVYMELFRRLYLGR